MSLALLAVATLAWLVEGGCPSRAIPVVIGSTTVPVRLIELQEGEAVELPCGDLLKGYAGLLRVFCLAGVQTTRHTCEPKSCPAGQRAPARIGDSADLLPAETRGLAHNKQESIPCRILKEGYLGHVHLRRRPPKAQASRGAFWVNSAQMLPVAIHNWKVPVQLTGY
ncbi:Kelch-like protein 12 [Durusdinium trenchii]|uniref:Kelch-like protein 12 n=1 Tax=Durusdinium trenchii TaxID=1381693 RepID=A0ABP0LWD3_9DINO